MLTTLFLVQPDPELREALRFGFEREGIAVVVPEEEPGLAASLAAARPELVVAGAASAEDGERALAQISAALAEAALKVPVLYVGNGIGRQQAVSGGAAEVVDHPALVRDVVTLGRLLAGPDEREPERTVGSLTEHFGLFYVVRALAAARLRGVLTLVRGLRHGELRFHDGEVTSAQVGELHGLAALHQLLLWTDADLELRREDVSERRQIPLEPGELIEQAERFLDEVREIAGPISPAHVYERTGEAPGDLPEPVAEVLELFDGRQSVADVAEDSPFRVFETLRIANRLLEVGLLRRRGGEPSGDPHALPLDRWLAGAPAPAAETAASPSKNPSKNASKKKKKKKKKRRKNGATTSPAPARAIDWSDVLPEGARAEHWGMSQVVPSASASGEIGAAPGGQPSPAAARRRKRVSSVEIDDEVVAEAKARAAERASKRRGEEAAGQPGDGVPEPLAPAPSGSFTEAEEAFFQAGHQLAASDPDPVESFDDLDEGYEVPRTFWQRLLRRPGQEPARRGKKGVKD